MADPSPIPKTVPGAPIAMKTAGGNGATPAETTPEPMIAFDDVSISFGDHAVLEHVSFQVNKGQTLCILGRSGVGKSVSLRILMGFLKPDSGSVRVEGREITELS